MRKIRLSILVSILSISASFAFGQSDVSKPVRQFIDGFNTGDLKSAYAAYASGEITIVDEFAPHRWTGPHAAQDWAADYEKHAQATGVTDGKVTYSAPTRTEIEGSDAYVIMPAVYLYKEHGKTMREEAQITSVLHLEAGV